MAAGAAGSSLSASCSHETTSGPSGPATAIASASTATSLSVGAPDGQHAGPVVVLLRPGLPGVEDDVVHAQAEQLVQGVAEKPLSGVVRVHVSPVRIGHQQGLTPV